MGDEPELPPPYSADWAEAGADTLVMAARRHLVEIDMAEIGGGDVLLFRWRDHCPAKHCAIATSPDTMVHAHDGACVTEVAFRPGGAVISPTHSVFPNRHCERSLMATLVLQTVGSVVGGMVGGPLGAMAGRALGGLAGAAIDNALMGGSEDKVVEGPRLKEIDGLTSTEGAPIPRVYGRARIGGQLIWATRLIEEANTKTERSGSQGGKGIGGGAQRPRPPPILISPIWRSACARDRSRISVASGRMDAKSISRRSPCGFIAERIRNPPIR